MDDYVNCTCFPFVTPETQLVAQQSLHDFGTNAYKE